MNRAFARTVDLTPPPAFRGVGGSSRGIGQALYDEGEVRIASSKLYMGGVTAAFGGMFFGAAVVGLLKPAIVGTTVAALGPLALIPGAALIGFGYYTLWTGGEKIAV
jgi:hypothetical protein